MAKSLQMVRVVAIVAAAALLVILVMSLRGLSVEDILSYKPANPFLAFCALIGFYCLKSIVIVLPLAPLIISAGIMFPTPLAIPITYFGITCEMTIGYLIGKYVGTAQYEKLISKYKTLGRWLAPSDERFNTVCFVIRLIPGPLPMEIMSMLFGATKIAYPRYLVFSLLGISPGMLAWIFAGSAISTPLSKEFLIPFSIALVISIAAFIGLQIILKREAERAKIEGAGAGIEGKTVEAAAEDVKTGADNADDDNRAENAGDADIADDDHREENAEQR
jgi:uncharacterized membrane protein YdjX (TVP38/TMEM64 family)